MLHIVPAIGGKKSDKKEEGIDFATKRHWGSPDL